MRFSPDRQHAVLAVTVLLSFGCSNDGTVLTGKYSNPQMPQEYIQFGQGDSIYVATGLGGMIVPGKYVVMADTLTVTLQNGFMVRMRYAGDTLFREDAARTTFVKSPE